ncbi:MAG TPA: hypothetical protein VIH00_08370, partial [Candidatus Limnocylindrales bacterium]
MLAWDRTDVSGFAGALAVGLIAGVGASLDGGQLMKTTEAFIGSGAKVAANGDVAVLAASNENVLSVAGTIGVTGIVGIAGAASGYRLVVATQAHITGATVDAGGNILVSADDFSVLDIIEGSLSGSIGITVGLSVGGVLLEKTTDAYIDGGATVDAHEQRGPIQASTGRFNVSFSTTDDLVRAPLGSLPDVVPTLLPSEVTGLDTPETGVLPVDGSLTGQRIATPAMSAVKGVAVTATNRDDVEIIAVGAGIAGGLSVPLSGGVDIAKNTTSAYISGGAKVNTNTPSAGSDQSVLVMASSDHYFLGVAGSLAGGLVSGFAPAALFALVHNTTQAYIHDATVKAGGDVRVEANASEHLVAIAAAVSGLTIVDLAGSANLVSIENLTQAYIDGTSVVTAQGSVLVAARDDSGLVLIAGAAALLGTTGFGASVGISRIVKDTRAFIGDGATVDGIGNVGAGIEVYRGDVTPTSVPKETIFGVGVQASSHEDVFNLAIVGQGGSSFSIVGSGAADIIQSDTTAYIGDADVNKASGGNALQQVNVSAVNEVDVLSVGGAAISMTAVGIPAAVDLGIIRNNTTAYLGDGADVNAKQDVDLFALARKKVKSFAVSLNGTSVGLAGAIVVYSIGSYVDKDGHDVLTAIDTDMSDAIVPDFPDLASFADDFVNRGADALAGLLSKVEGFVTEIEGGTPPAPVSSAVDAGETITFAPAAVNSSANTIGLGAAQVLVAGDAVVYGNGGGDNIDGLVDGETYYISVDPSDSQKIRLHVSRSDAL